MGLAPMGDPEVYKEEVGKMVRVDKNGKLHFDLSYFNFQNLSWERLSPKFYREVWRRSKTRRRIYTTSYGYGGSFPASVGR